LAEVIPRLPKEFPVPVVVVQHMPPLFTKMLADRLNARSNLNVYEGEAGKTLQPGTVWIAPGNYHMTVAQHGITNLTLELNQDPPENSCRPAVDVLFRSVAALRGLGILSVVLTGMGSDGTLGVRFIREAGGEVFVQDEASSVVWGMPGSIAQAGLADEVYPLQQLGPEIVRRVQNNRQSADATRPHGSPLRNTPMQASAKAPGSNST
jgi:two-component system chemotaxis response regulator CheB